MILHRKEHRALTFEKFSQCDAYGIVTVGAAQVARSEIVMHSLAPSFKSWTCEDAVCDKLLLYLAGTAELEPDEHSRCIPRLAIWDWNRFEQDQLIAQPVLLPLHKLKGMWSGAGANPKKLSLPLAPAASATGPVLHFTISRVDKTETEELAEPTVEEAKVGEIDFHVAVFVRGARNVPLDKCRACHGRLRRLEHESFQVHVRCYSGECVRQ